MTKVRPLHEHNGFAEDTGDQSDSPPPSRVPVFSQSGQHPFQHLVKSRVILKSQFEQKKLQHKISAVMCCTLICDRHNPNKSQLTRQPTFEYSPIESDEEDESAYAEPLSDSGQVRM